MREDRTEMCVFVLASISYSRLISLGIFKSLDVYTQPVHVCFFGYRL
jgi:hypothetical protein